MSDTTEDDALFQHTLKLTYDPAKLPRTRMELSWAQLQALVDEFDLGRLTQMDKPLTTQCNTTDPFRTGQGMFMLRARHDEEFGERVEYLHGIIDYLVEHKFPAPAVMRTRGGKSWTTWGNRIVEIHRFLPHDQGNHRDWRRMNAASAVLGDLHALLTEASEGKTPVPPEMRNDITPSQCDAMLYETHNLIQAQVVENPFAEEAAQVCVKARLAMEPLLDDYERIVGSLPWMTVHGDYHFWNILYRADQIIGVVDYDFVQERERIFDIAYAMQNVIDQVKISYRGELRDAKNPAWRNVSLWLQHYDETSHLPLSDFERACLPFELLRIFLVGVATSGLQGDPVMDILKYKDDLDLYCWIANQEALFL